MMLRLLVLYLCFLAVASRSDAFDRGDDGGNQAKNNSKGNKINGQASIDEGGKQRRGPSHLRGNAPEVGFVKGEFEASIQILLELRDKEELDGGARRMIGEESNSCDPSSPDFDETNTPEDCAELDVPAIEALEYVQNTAFGLDALKEIAHAAERKITTDQNCMIGVHAYNGTIDYQQLLSPNSTEDGSRRLVPFLNNDFARNYWANLLFRYWGALFSSIDDGDGRRQLIDENRRYLQDYPDEHRAACENLAKKILRRAGRRYPLLSNVDRIGLRLTIPGMAEDPMEVWYPSLPAEEE
jgi:hypothetical protein